MLKFLRARGFRVLQLTLCNVSETTSVVGAANVILLSQIFRKAEATWGVIFNGSYFHNFDVYSLETLSFINKPIVSAYLVSHQRWVLGDKRPGKPKGKVRRSRRTVPFSALRIETRATSPAKH